MAFFELDDIFTYQDVNEIKQLWASDNPPDSPGDGEVWLDTSVSPNKLRRYTDSTWESIGDMTAADVLTLLKTVDGDGSGLDADTLDGKESDDFVQFDASGNVGIGTTSPGAHLDIQSDITGSAGSYTNHPVLRLTQGTDGTYNTGDIHSEIQFYTKDPGGVFPESQAYIRTITTRGDGVLYPDAGLVIGTSGIDGIVSDRMTIDGEGRIGIGTTSPSYPLQLNTTGKDALITAKRAEGSQAYMTASSDRVVIGSLSNHQVRIAIDGSYMLTVDTSGNIGIGTTNPGEKLEVNGNAKVGGTVTINDNLVIQHDGNDAYIQNKSHGQKIIFTGEDSSGTQKSLLTLDPEAPKIETPGASLSLMYDEQIASNGVLTTTITEGSTGMFVIRDRYIAFSAIGATCLLSNSSVHILHQDDGAAGRFRSEKDGGVSKICIYFENGVLNIQNTYLASRPIEFGFFGLKVT